MTNALEWRKEEAEIVKLCFELYPKLASMGKVAEKLNEMGYRTKKFYAKGKDAAGSTKFDKKKISNILTNHFYIGKVRFKDKDGKQYIFDGEHKPIIMDKKLWDNVQNILVNNRETHKTFKQNKYEMLFLGLLTCGECGSTMTNSSKEKKGKMYLYLPTQKTAAVKPRMNVREWFSASARCRPERPLLRRTDLAKARRAKAGFKAPWVSTRGAPLPLHFGGY